MELEGEGGAPRRKHKALEKERFREENCYTNSGLEQRNVEESCLRLFEKAEKAGRELGDTLPVLNRAKTIGFVRRGLTELSQGYECLDASRPWLVYWLLHSLELLGEELSEEEKAEIVGFLERCQDPSGGFAGGPGQVAHLAPTYAAVNALCILGTKQALECINRPAMVEWMNRLRQEDGAFMMHIDGELDIRGVYCALAVARLTNIYSEELFKGTEHWLVRCQSYEGGFGGVPGMEAHGGYSFCGLAALMLMKRERLCNLETLALWAASRQMRLEGGFQGRTNKLVDGCYSFWQGGIFPLLHKMFTESPDSNVVASLPQHWLFDQGALQEYILLCCQDHRGGLLDKPGKSRDFYHTCYTLSGLALAQTFLSPSGVNTSVLGHPSNLVEATHPVYNIGVASASNASRFFDRLQVPSVRPSI